MRWIIAFVFFIQGAQAGIVHQETAANVHFEVDEVAKGLGIVWGFAFLPNGNILFTERKGNIGIFDRSQKKVKYFTGVPKVHWANQGGMLDIQLSPEFAKSRRIFFVYAREESRGNTTVLATAKLGDNDLQELKVLFVAKVNSSTSHHFGSRIVFDRKGHLFLAVGDRGKRKKAQDLSVHNGKVIRLNLDGSIPKDNPFLNNAKQLPEIWSYGHRNPQGMVWDQPTGNLWVMEHGPRGGDELNLVQPGKNYGWPTISYGREYVLPMMVGESTHKAGMEQPVKYFVPSIAPSGLELYRGDKFPEWKGSIFSGALKLTHLNRLVLNGTKVVKEERLLKSINERIRSVRTGPSGYLWVSTDTGRILRLMPK